MKVLFIGGTGFISTSVSKLTMEKGWELFLLNRGQRQDNPPGCHSLIADMTKPEEVRVALGDLHFDVVVDWVAFTADHIERDLALFRGRTKQYVFISSASAYQKPPTHHLITESTPLHNPYWQYSRDKIACEDRLMRAYREEIFPVTIVRPSLTYARQFPIALGHAFHITTDEVLTWNQIYETVADALGVVPKIVHIPSDFIARVMPAYTGTLLGDKTWSVVFDNTKIKSFVPGFQAVIPFREGIRSTVAWFGADPARRRVDSRVNEEMDAILKLWQAGGAR